MALGLSLPLAAEVALGLSLPLAAEVALGLSLPLAAEVVPGFPLPLATEVALGFPLLSRERLLPRRQAACERSVPFFIEKEPNSLEENKSSCCSCCCCWKKSKEALLIESKLESDQCEAKLINQPSS